MRPAAHSALEAMENQEGLPMKRPLFTRDFTLVVIGQVISLFGNAILRFALPLYLLDVTGSRSLFGLCSAAAFLPMVALTPIGGVVADRVNKQRIMVALDFFTCALVTLLTLVLGRLPLVPLLVGVLMLLYGVSGAYQPAVQASMPLLCPTERLMDGNAVINQVSALSGLLGPIAGSIVYGAFGLTPILVSAAVCFFASAVMELFIRIPHTPRPAGAGVLAVVRGDLGESLGFLRREKPVLLRYIALVCAFNLAMSALIIVGLPVLIKQTLGLGDVWYGANQGLLAAGSLTGGILAGGLGKWITVRRSWLPLLLCAVCLVPMGGCLLAGLPSRAAYGVITAAAFVMMACSTVFTVTMLSYVQLQTPAALVGKVISLLLTLSLCAQPVGQAVYGALLEALKGREGWLLLGAACAAFGIALTARHIAHSAD